LIIGAQLFGAFGALLATPIVAAGWVVIASVYRSLVRGETADQMLANRRKPWVIRPRIRFYGRGRRTVTLPENQAIESGITASEDYSPAGHDEDKPAEYMAEVSPPQHVKGNALHLDHIDLLRTVPPSTDEHPGEGEDEG
jgi:hypothetical protein